MQNKKMRFFIPVFLFTLLFSMVFGNAMILTAATTDSTPTYSVKIIDDASLFSAKEKEEIQKEIQEFTEYGNALVATTDTNDVGTIKQLAIQYYDQAFGTEVGAVFLIDMKDREIYWYTEGSLYKKLSVKRAMDITDNVYTYASKKEYATCAIKAYEQAITVLRGGKIAQKMKYYGNALLALILALFINYIWARKTSYIRSDVIDKDDSYRQEIAILPVSEQFLGTETRESAVYKMREERKHQSSFGGDYSESYSGGSSSSSSSSSGSSSSSSSSSYHSGSSSGSSSRHSGGGAGHRF